MSHLCRICGVASHSRQSYYSFKSRALQLRQNQLVKYKGCFFMYLIGAELTGKTGFASMILFQRVYKDLKKYYHVLDLKRYPFNSDVNYLIDSIESIYNNAKYVVRKPRFSQIGRPKKIITEKPLIFAACCDASLEYIQYLKQNKISSAGVFVNDKKTGIWKLEANA
jgi:hypothetical protein